MIWSSFSDRITCIEDLSNELFYDIVEYLRGWDLHNAFSNLNSRFQHLFVHSALPLNIVIGSSSPSEMEHYCKKFLIPNKHRILSLYFDNELIIDTILKHCMIDSSFHRLQSIEFDELTPDYFVMLLFYLRSLPRLFSLSALLFGNWTGDLGSIYRMIFSLPALKYNNLLFESDDPNEQLNISLPFTTNERFSTVEHLNIRHSCTTGQLFSILRHTPELRHLTCENLIGSGSRSEQFVTVSDLKYLSISCASMKLVEFESIIKILSSQLQVLNIRHFHDEDYFDADRWERMIKNHIPHLSKFHYEYREFDSSEYLENCLYVKMNQFTSPFWTERPWFFQAEISTDVIAYSIYSHKYGYKPIWLQKTSLSLSRKRWFDDCEPADTDTRLNQSTEDGIISKQENLDTSATRFIPAIELSISDILPEMDQSFIDKYKIVFSAVQFIHLNIDYPSISSEMFVKIVQLLPNLDSLKISSLQLTLPDSCGVNLAEMCLLTSINNKITKVCHENTTDMGQVEFLLVLCLCMQHFQIHVSKTMDLDALLRLILIKTVTSVPQLRSLCLCIPDPHDGITRQLQNTIESERLLSNHLIKRSGDKIVLKWDWFWWIFFNFLYSIIRWNRSSLAT